MAAREQWGDIYDRIAGLVRAHRTTLVFVNTRRLSERVAHNLRERLGEEWREPALPAGPPSPYPSQAASVAGLLDVAWRELLRNQPHDSICGCSIDQVHDEMRTRFDRCWQIGEELTRQSMRADQDELARLKRENETLKKERDFLKRAAAFFARESQ
mgnify:CR=1 FL=1